MAAPITESILVGRVINPVGKSVTSLSSHKDINEKTIPITVNDTDTDNKVGDINPDSKRVPNISDSEDDDREDVIIVTGADASAHLLSIRDDRDPALTFRGMFLATVLAGFQATMCQIYKVS